MEGMLNVQMDLHNSIKRGLQNYKKSPRDRITLEYIEARLENLETDWASFRTNHAKLYETTSPSDLSKNDYVSKGIYDGTEDSYLLYKSTLKAVLKLYRPSQENESTSRETNKTSSSVRLPKITIPTFSGSYSEWTTFRDLFVSLVHNNRTLDNVQKLHYLKTQLTGEAAQLIKHTPITDANYTQCWLLLEQRYNNKKYLADCILKRLFGQRRLTTESASGLKELIDTTTDCISALKNIGVEVTTWDIILIHIVTFKLDPETRKQWELHTNNDVNELPTLKQLKDFIESRFRALEFVDTKKTGPPSSKPYTKTKAFLATNATYLRCEFCSEHHKLCFCKKFAQQSCSERRDFVAKNSICYNCLGSNHNVNTCKNPASCKICDRRHHSLLHENINIRAAIGSTEKDTVEENSLLDSASPVVSCLSTKRVTGSGSVLLATALVKVESTAGNTQVVRALVDQGSQACFITEAVVQQLRLRKRPIGSTITGLGGNQPVTSKCVVTIKLTSQWDPDFHLEIEAYVLKNITTYLPEQNISNEAIDWIEQDLVLADPQFNLPNKVDLLLGANVYSRILLDGIKRSPTGGLIAQNTLLGWILSGTVEGKANQASVHITAMHTQINENDALKKFWEIEEQTKDIKKLWTEEEQKCEDILLRTTKRTNASKNYHFVTVQCDALRAILGKLL